MRILRTLAQVAIAILGIASIVATGGGGGASTECSFFSSTCNPSFPPGSLNYAALSPSHQTVQVGTSISITANVSVGSSPRFDWCRAAPGSNECAPQPQYTGAILTIPAVALGDDGARFRVTATGSLGSATSTFSVLRVSSLPPVVFEDGEFLDAEWTTYSVVVPPQGGPVPSVSRMITGGHPGAFRMASYDVPAANGSAQVFHTWLRASYNPSSQGAIYLIDYSRDCHMETEPTSGLFVTLMFEQDGRRYAHAIGERMCSPGGWLAWGYEALGAGDFSLVDGPACPAGAACPDFSATAAPLRFGIMTSVERPPAPAGRNAHGFDNVEIKVWRH